MSGPRDPIAAWREVSAAAARSTGYRPAATTTAAPRRLAGLASIGVMVAALAIIVAGLALRPPADRLGANGPVVAQTDDGTFRLELSTPRGVFVPGDAIATVARVTYLGPDPAITVQHSHSQLVFRIQEVDGVRAMDGGSRLSCESTNVVKGEPLVVPFEKSGSPNDPSKGFDLAWYQDPTLTLPVGTWRIVASADLGVGGCAPTHHLSVSNVIHVVAPTGDGPVVDVAQDDAFRLELATPRRTYAPTDAIEPVVTVTFLGPAAETTVHGGVPVAAFEIEEVDGPRTWYPTLPASCSTSTIRRDAPVTIPFVKSGPLDGPFGRAWYDDPVLHLPVGTWRIRAYTMIATDDGPAPSDGSVACGTRGHGLEATNVITVIGDPAPSALPTGGPTIGPSPSVPRASPLPSFTTGPVVDSGNDGTFRLDLITPHGTYTADEPILPVATLFYVGPDPSISFGHSDPAVVFSIEEVSGDRSMTGSAADSCTFTTLQSGKPSAITFRKSGQVGLGFDLAWFRDPVLRLPPGTWRIRVRLEAYVPGCDAGAETHEPIADNVISVVAGPATAPLASSPTPGR